MTKFIYLILLFRNISNPSVEPGIKETVTFLLASLDYVFTGCKRLLSFHKIHIGRSIELDA